MNFRAENSHFSATPTCVSRTLFLPPLLSKEWYPKELDCNSKYGDTLLVMNDDTVIGLGS